MRKVYCYYCDKELIGGKICPCSRDFTRLYCNEECYDSIEIKIEEFIKKLKIEIKGEIENEKCAHCGINISEIPDTLISIDKDGNKLCSVKCLFSQIEEKENA